MFGLITQFITIFCCNLYPIFASFKAIRNRDGDEYSRWFIYWIMFSLFLSVTYVTDWLLWWLPFYEVLKLCIAVWLLPFFKGSKILYTGLVHPHLMENEQQIDMFVNSISTRLLSLGKVLFSFAIQKTTEAYAAQTFAANIPTLQPVPTQQPNPPSEMYPPQQPNPTSEMYPPQQPNPTSAMYHPEQQNPTSGMYPPQQPNPSSGMHPPQQPNPTSGMYPLQESFPPTYSEIISSQGTAVPVRKGEFSDDEDMGRNVPPVDRVSVNRDELATSAPVSPDHTQPRMRETHKQAERPRSELISQHTQGPLSRQRSPQYKITRANTEAEPLDRKRTSARQSATRHSTLDSARQKKPQDK